MLSDTASVKVVGFEKVAFPIGLKTSITVSIAISDSRLPGLAHLVTIILPLNQRLLLFALLPLVVLLVAKDDPPRIQPIYPGDQRIILLQPDQIRDRPSYQTKLQIPPSSTLVHLIQLWFFDQQIPSLPPDFGEIVLVRVDLPRVTLDGEGKEGIVVRLEDDRATLRVGDDTGVGGRSDGGGGQAGEEVFVVIPLFDQHVPQID